MARHTMQRGSQGSSGGSLKSSSLSIGSGSTHGGNGSSLVVPGVAYGAGVPGGAGHSPPSPEGSDEPPLYDTVPSEAATYADDNW